MSPQIHANPAHIREFAHFLHTSNNELHSTADRMRSRLSSLNDSWRDHRYEEFSTDVDDLVSKLHKFIEQADGYIDYLKRQAQILEMYEDLPGPRR
jgi:uncharacterized protein YukE